MGNIKEKGLCGFHSKFMIEGIPHCPLDFNLCEHCVYGKHNWGSFSYCATKEKGIMLLINTNVFRYVLAPSIEDLCTMSHL